MAWWRYLREEIAAEFERLSRGRQGVLVSMSVVTPASAGVSRVAAGRWFITPHAIQAYQRRVRKCSREAALSDLVRLSRRARYVRELVGGAELWRTGKPERVRFVVGAGDGELPALVTVLTGGYRAETEATA